MPAHDWTRVFPGTFHNSHLSWIARLTDSLNAGLLPGKFYALAEQHAGDIVPDVITLTTRGDEQLSEPVVGATALAEARPQVSVHVSAAEDKTYRILRRTLVVRHRSGRRIVALIEILFPGNESLSQNRLQRRGQAHFAPRTSQNEPVPDGFGIKDRQLHLDLFVEKVFTALHNGIHVLVVDVHPPSERDRQGIHGAVWDLVSSGGFEMPMGKNLTAAAYLADRMPEAFVESFAIGEPLPKMPVFLTLDWYISVELENAYSEAYAALPAIIRDAIEGRAPAEWEQAVDG